MARNGSHSLKRYADSHNESSLISLQYYVKNKYSSAPWMLFGSLDVDYWLLRDRGSIIINVWSCQLCCCGEDGKIERVRERQKDRDRHRACLTDHSVVHLITSQSPELNVKMPWRMRELFQHVIPTVSKISRFHNRWMPCLVTLKAEPG